MTSQIVSIISSVPFRCSVPQGSLLSAVLFSLYMLPLGLIFKKYISLHCYADNTQICFLLNHDVQSILLPLFNCLWDVNDWLLQNSPTLNENETKIIVFDSHIPQLTNNLGSYASHLSHTVLVSSLKLDKQVSTVVKTSYHQLCHISKAKLYITHKDLEKLMHLFIISRLDYCTSLYLGLQLSLF